MKCRHCGAELSLPLVDLGSAPPSNAYLTEQTIHTPEKWFPLRVLVCERCWLVQTEDFAGREELFSADYAYFSSFATSWLAHAENYVDAMVERLNLDSTAHVIEIAANDGYLLQYVQARGIPCTGVEPTSSTAAVAREKGLDIIEDFFGNRLARELVDQGKQADLITANNVLAHVPDINDFVTGFALLLKPEGVATFEFPHLSNLLRFNQFDTIYHEHFSYLSLRSVTTIFERNGLSVFDVEKLSTHGGSLRVFAQRSDSGRQQTTERVQSLLMAEQAEGLASTAAYIGFQDRTDLIKNKFLLFLLQAKEEGSTVAAYGAAAKGNTLMNYAGVRPDLIRFVVDRNPAKQGKFMPGSRIPIVEEMYLRQHKPDYVVVFPWNLKDEIACQLQYVEEWGGKIVAAVPKMEIV
jgi:SAM-dependent methyltransferase